MNNKDMFGSEIVDMEYDFAEFLKVKKDSVTIVSDKRIELG